MQDKIYYREYNQFYAAVRKFTKQIVFFVSWFTLVKWSSILTNNSLLVYSINENSLVFYLIIKVKSKIKLFFGMPIERKLI